jgi:hypothetical protein
LGVQNGGVGVVAKFAQAANDRHTTIDHVILRTGAIIAQSQQKSFKPQNN